MNQAAGDKTYSFRHPKIGSANSQFAVLANAVVTTCGLTQFRETYHGSLGNRTGARCRRLFNRVYASGRRRLRRSRDFLRGKDVG